MTPSKILVIATMFAAPHSCPPEAGPWCRQERAVSSLPLDSSRKFNSHGLHPEPGGNNKGVFHQCTQTGFGSQAVKSYPVSMQWSRGLLNTVLCVEAVKRHVQHWAGEYHDDYSFCAYEQAQQQ